MDDDDFDLELVVDGNEIDTNPFVRKILLSVVGGVTEQLNGVDEDWKKLEIVIKR